MKNWEAQRPELANLFKETVALYLRLTADAAAIHGFGHLSGPRRTLLVALAESGPQTVSHLARSRAQTRQRLQPLINALVDDGLVMAVPNPMHRQSPLMVLTARGDRQVRKIVETEGALMVRLKLGSSRRKLTNAAAVLRDVREALESQLRQLLADPPPRRRGKAASSRGAR